MSNYTTQEKQTLIANLIKLAKSDGRMDPREIIFIQTIALKHQVTKFEFDDIISRVDFISDNAPVDENDKLHMFFIILTGMNIDQHADEAEKEFCKRLGNNLRIDATTVNKAIDFMSANASAVVTEEAFLAALQ